MGLVVDTLMTRLEEEERVRCGVMVSTREFIDRRWEQQQEEARRVNEEFTQQAWEAIPPALRQVRSIKFEHGVCAYVSNGVLYVVPCSSLRL